MCVVMFLISKLLVYFIQAKDLGLPCFKVLLKILHKLSFIKNFSLVHNSDVYLKNKDKCGYRCFISVE